MESIIWMDNPTNYRAPMQTFKVALIASLVGLSIGTNYLLIGLWNVKLMDFIVFIGGFCFGPVVGISIGVISWGVYGSMNPQGFMLPVWLATMFSEPIYGVVGALLRMALGDNVKTEWWRASVLFALTGALLTVTYDVVTNAVFGLSMGWSALFAIIVGFIPFGLLHVVSNLLFFFFGSVPVISAINNIMGGETNVNTEK